MCGGGAENVCGKCVLGGGVDCEWEVCVGGWRL